MYSAFCFFWGFFVGFLMLTESQNILGTCGRLVAQPHTKNKASFEVRSYFIVISGCSGHQSCQAPLRTKAPNKIKVWLYRFSPLSPGRVNSSTPTSDGHPEGELPTFEFEFEQRARPLLPARAQGPRAFCIWSHEHSHGARGERCQALQQ